MSVVETASVVVCSGGHICVESWSTVGLDGEGLDVAAPIMKVVRGGAVDVVKPEGPRPL